MDCGNLSPQAVITMAIRISKGRSDHRLSRTSNSLDIDSVYPPQHDSQLLIDSLEKTELTPGRRVLDFCTGSGVIAIAAAELGAASVIALDICPRAVRCSQGNAVYGVSTSTLAKGPVPALWITHLSISSWQTRLTSHPTGGRHRRHPDHRGPRTGLGRGRRRAVGPGSVV